MIRHTVLFLLISLTSVTTFGQFPKIELFKNNKLEYRPAMYELPTYPLAASTNKSNNIWVVYSDRNDNPVYSDVTANKTISKIHFLDSFYVLKISDEMFELIRYNPKTITTSGQISDAEKIEYVGWVPKSNLILNEHSFVDAVSKYPYKYATLINGTNVFPITFTYFNGSTIKVFSDPELKNVYTNQSLKLNEIVYVVKKYKDHVLISKGSHFDTKSAQNTIIGWVHTTFVQQWSARLNMEINQSEHSDTIATYLFPAKNHAINFENNALTAIPLKSNECRTTENFWRKNPVYRIENITKENKNYSIIETGSIIKPFDNSQAYVYSSTGSKITYPAICSILEKTKINNIVITLNLDEDTKEYYTSLIETFQELDQYFSVQQEGHYTFSLIHSSDNAFSKITSVENFSQLLPKAIDLIKENVQLKNHASPSGILNGFSSATSYFKNHIEENNILISFSTKGDYNTDDNMYKNKLSKIIADLSNCNTKVIMYQPYSSTNGAYANFIQQSKNILKRYAEKSIPIRNSIQITKTESSYSNNFKSIETDLSNIYCLDFPSNAVSQGFIIFPSIGNRINKKVISITLDSLFFQLKNDQKQTFDDILASFNSSSIFSTKVNPYFERYYNMFKTLPRNLEFECKNINFDYFAKGYTIHPYDPLKTNRPYTQNLLLTDEEYQELCSLFKRLQIDNLLIEPSEINKKTTQAILKDEFNKRTSISGTKYQQPTLKDFLYETCGYQTYTHMLNILPLNEIVTVSTLSKDEYFTLMTKLKKSFDVFYLIQDNPNYSFYSNGIKYYWINETLLP